MDNYDNKKLAEYKKFLCGKSCAVLGVGISNIPLIKFLTESGARVTARDKKSADEIKKNGNIDIDGLCGEGVKFICGEGYLDGLCEEIIYKTPGLRFDNPKILEAQKNGAVVTSEMEAFISLCPSKIIAITGSDGKTTTTTLISKILEDAGYRVFLGGNIGKPLLYEVGSIRPCDFTVLELSSFQLHTINRFPNASLPTPKISFPDVAVITNLSPNHLDWHTDFEEYCEAKKAIYSFLRPGGKLVTNIGNGITAKYALEARKNGVDVELFSAHTEGGKYSCDDNTVYKDGKAFLERCDIKLPGIHNVENYMAACAATSEFVRPENVLHVAKSFGGVEHRLEYCGTICGADYYNSSIDSSPTRTIAAVSSFPKAFDKKLILIMGGYDKHIPYAPLGVPVCKAARAVFLCGATAPKIKEAIESAENFDESTKIFMCAGFEEAIRSARDFSLPGDKVILTPASASFDMFRSFEERGRLFKKIVGQLK